MNESIDNKTLLDTIKNKRKISNLKTITCGIGKIRLDSNKCVCYVDKRKLERRVNISGNSINIGYSNIPIYFVFKEIDFNSPIYINSSSEADVHFLFNRCTFRDEFMILVNRGEVILENNNYGIKGKMEDAKKKFFSIDCDNIVLSEEKILTDKFTNNIYINLRNASSNGMVTLSDSTIESSEISINTDEVKMKNTIIRLDDIMINCNKMQRIKSPIISDRVIISEDHKNCEQLRDIVARTLLYNGTLFKNTPLSDLSHSETIATGRRRIYLETKRKK